jgi:hypothetical protein
LFKGLKEDFGLYFGFFSVFFMMDFVSLLISSITNGSFTNLILVDQIPLRFGFIIVENRELPAYDSNFWYFFLNKKKQLNLKKDRHLLS